MRLTCVLLYPVWLAIALVLMIADEICIRWPRRTSKIGLMPTSSHVSAAAYTAVFPAVWERSIRRSSLLRGRSIHPLIERSPLLRGR